MQVPAFVSSLLIMLMPVLVLLFSSCGLSGRPGESSAPADQPTSPPHVSTLVPEVSDSEDSGISTDSTPEGQEASGSAISEATPGMPLSTPAGADGSTQPIASPQDTGTGADPGAGGNPGAGSNPEPGGNPGTGSNVSGDAEIIVRSDNILSSKEKEALLNDLDTQLRDLFGTVDKISADPETELAE